MSIASEASVAPTQLQAALESGVEQISGNQTVSFTQYTKSTLPTDGYVFWVASSTVQSFSGSLHVITERRQDEDQTIATNQFVFTAEEEVSQLNLISPGTMWIGTWQTDGATLNIAFASSGMTYRQAGLWHYRGFAVYPALASQLVANIDDLPEGPIVSNSLPIWLGLASQSAAYPPFGDAAIYPSYLVPDNITPPYVTAHIEPEETISLGAFPNYAWPGTPTPPYALQQMPSSQLMRDDVRLTMYGFNNQQAIQFYSALIDYSTNTDAFGFCNSPSIKDAKRTQVEIAAIAMQKMLQIKASYYQSTADAIARRLILSAAVTTST